MLFLDSSPVCVPRRSGMMSLESDFAFRDLGRPNLPVFAEFCHQRSTVVRRPGPFELVGLERHASPFAVADLDGVDPGLVHDVRPSWLHATNGKLLDPDLEFTLPDRDRHGGRGTDPAGTSANQKPRLSWRSGVEVTCLKKSLHSGVAYVLSESSVCNRR